MNLSLRSQKANSRRSSPLRIEWAQGTGEAKPTRDSLDGDQVGVSRVRREPGWRNRLHDHEEIYVLFDGRVPGAIDDESVEMESGDAVWIPPNQRVRAE